MKLWFQTVFASILFCVWMTPPQAAALPSASTAKNIVEEFPVAISTSSKHSIVVELLGKNGEVIRQLSAKLTPEAELAKYKPSQVMKMLEAPEVTKKAGFSFMKMAKEKLLRLPIESFGFFVSLGAIVTWDLIQNASYNPVGFEQLVQSQLDPLGQVAFYAFMVSQGAASEPFIHMIQNGHLNPRFAPFIKYGGMSIGMMASNVVHEVGTFGACAKRWIPQNGKKQELDNCDKAFHNWNERGGLAGVTNEWKPGLLSLIASTFISGLIESGFHQIRFIVSPFTKTLTSVVVTNVQKWTAQRVITVGAIELALLAVPGGAIVKGFRMVGPGATWLAQMTLFNWVQHAIEVEIADQYGNAVQGADLKKMDQKIVSNLQAAKQQRWNETTSANLKNDIQELSKQMRKWRQLNMSRVLQSQANWEQKLTQLTLMYRASHMFYSDFISRQWERKYSPENKSPGRRGLSVLDLNFPLNGVLLAKAGTNDENTWLENPDLVEMRQLYTIQSALQNLTLPSLAAGEQKIASELIQELKQSDAVKVGLALDKLNCYLHMNRNGNCKWTSISSAFTRVLMDLRKSFGNPHPIWKPGLGYLITYEAMPANKKEIAPTLYAKSFGRISTMSFPESMIASMMFGPDLENNESALVSNNGFKDIFKAPKIRASDRFMPNLQNKGLHAPLFDVFNTGIYDYLNKGNVRNSVLNKEQEAFDKWWKKFPETQYLMAWLDYERIYQGNIALLIQSLEVGEEKLLNYGPVSNGVLTAHSQELKLYTLLLGEIMKDNQAIRNVLIPDEFFGNVVFPVSTFKQTGRAEIFAYLRNNWNVSFSGYQQTLQTQAGSNEKKLRNFVWQNEILEMIEDIKKSIRKLQTRNIQVTKNQTQNMPVSTLDPAELKAKVTSLTEYLKELENNAFKSESMLNPQQAELTALVFKNMQASLIEMERLAEIANSVSYVPRHNETGFVKRECVEAPRTPGLGGVSAVKRAVEGC